MPGILLDNFHLSGYSIRCHPQNYELEPLYTGFSEPSVEWLLKGIIRRLKKSQLELHQLNYRSLVSGE